MDTLAKFKKHIESKGFTVYAIMLKGSQNYNLDDAESDIDANAILLPNNLTEVREGLKEHFSFEEGEVTCHDIRHFAHIVAKGNPQWIEVCHTEYQIGRSLDMFKHCTVNPSALKGMVMEKVHAFEKLYPSRAKYVKQFGYDPKQLHHIVRLVDLLESGKQTYKYNMGSQRQVGLVAIKRGVLPKSEAEEMRDEYIAKLASIYETKKLEYSPQTIDEILIDEIVLHHIQDADTENLPIDIQKAMVTELQTFVHRVQVGEVRSRRTYAAFVKILSQIKDQ